MRFDFLICSERSGSNLITKILDAHPEVCGPSPSHLIRAFVSNLYRYGNLDHPPNWQALLADAENLMRHKIAVWESAVDGELLRKGCRQGSLADVVRAVYQQEARLQGKSRLFVKENHTHALMGFLLSHFPEARFLWLVRDPRDMALTWKAAGSALGGVKTAVATWLWDQRESLKIHACLADLGKVLRVRFEDLLSDSVGTMRRVCAFLKLEYAPQMLEFHARANTAANADRLTSWRDLRRPLLADNFNLYRTSLSEAEIRYVEALCGEEMALFGYTREFEDPGQPDELERLLPPEELTRQWTAQESRIYPPFDAALARIAARRLHLS